MAKDKQKKEENEAVLRKMMDLEATIKHLKACGVEPVLPLDCLKLAEEAYMEGHFDNATCHIDSGLRSAKGFFKAYAMAFSKKIFYDIHKAKQYGDTYEVEMLYQQAQDYIANDRFEEAAIKTRIIRQGIRDFFDRTVPVLSLELSPANLKSGLWNRVKFVVKNTSISHAKDVRIGVKGPVEVTILPEINKIRAKDQVDIEVGLKPTGAGEFPIDVWFKGISMTSNKVFACQAKVWASAARERGANEAREVDFFEINELFLIHGNGRLMGRVARKGVQELDDDTTSGMLTAMKDFVKGTVPGEGTILKTFSFSDLIFVIEKGNHVNLVVIVQGTPPPQLSEETHRVIEKVEGVYAGGIEDWDGSTKLKGLEQNLTPLFDLPSKIKMKETEATVKVKSGLEFYRGFVRLKVGVINETETVITDANLLLTYNKEALMLDKIEPELRMDGSIVMLGAVQPGEKKTVAYYLDPLICQESTVDCTLTYKDYKGNLEHVDMKRRPMDIVCPLFYTPTTLNIAMLKRLMSDLRDRDTKIFAVLEDIPIERSYERAREIVQGHDVKFVRELKETGPDGTKFIEAWYYGKVKELSEEMVIRVSARSDTRTVEVFVAGQSIASITGLLAELGHRLLEVVLGSQLITEKEIKSMILREGSLLERISESEALPESGDCLDLNEILFKARKKG